MGAASGPMTMATGLAHGSSAGAAAGLRKQILRIFALLSGSAALIYQVVWSGQLALFLGNHAQADAVILATLGGGLAAGDRTCVAATGVGPSMIGADGREVLTIDPRNATKVGCP